MARRADHSREELEALIVGASRDIIAENGLSHLSTRRIAAEIGYSPGTIYNVFNDLDAVISKVNTHTLKELNATLSGLQMTDDALANARLVLAAYLEFQNSEPLLWVALVQHSTKDYAGTDAGYAAQIEKAFAHVEAVLSPLFGPGHVDEVRVAVRVLWASLQGISNLPPNAPMLLMTGLTKQDLSIHLVETYLRGIVAVER